MYHSNINITQQGAMALFLDVRVLPRPLLGATLHNDIISACSQTKVLSMVCYEFSKAIFFYIRANAW